MLLGVFKIQTAPMYGIDRLQWNKKLFSSISVATTTKLSRFFLLLSNDVITCCYWSKAEGSASATNWIFFNSQFEWNATEIILVCTFSQNIVSINKHKHMLINVLECHCDKKNEWKRKYTNILCDIFIRFRFRFRFFLLMHILTMKDYS